MHTFTAQKVSHNSFTQYINQWQQASFHHLIDAFSQPNQHLVSAFQLSLPDTLALVNHPETKILTIHMSLIEDKWYPILQGKSSLEDQGLENTYLPNLVQEPLALGVNTYLPTVAPNPHIITPTVAQEYVENWQRAPLSVVMDVFHAPLKTDGQFYKIERLQYTYFGVEVAQELKAMQPDHLTIFAGKANATSQNQPFTFRPIVVATRDDLNMMFDVTVPVPPFKPFD